MKYNFCFTLILLVFVTACDECEDCSNEKYVCQQVFKNSTAHAASLNVYSKSIIINTYNIKASDSLIIENTEFKAKNPCRLFYQGKNIVDSVSLVFNDSKKYTYLRCGQQTNNPCKYIINENILDNGSYLYSNKGDTLLSTFSITAETYNKAK